MIIHCVGDSHANFFSGFDEMQPEWPAQNVKNRLSFLRSYRIGPVLAYKLCEYGTTSMGREKLELLLNTLQPGSHLLFCFGEIDCRAHVLLQSKKQDRSPEAVVDDVVARYLSVIKEVAGSGFLPLIWNVIPSAPTGINDRITVPPQYLFHGSCEERNEITRVFNQRLKKGALENNIPFLDIFDQLLSADGTVDRSYYSDEIHLSQKAMPMALKALAQACNGYSFCNETEPDDAPVYYSTVA